MHGIDKNKWGTALLLAVLFVLGTRQRAWAGPEAQTIPTAGAGFLEKKEEGEELTPTATEATPATPSQTAQGESLTPSPTPTGTDGRTTPGAFSGLFAGLPVWLWLCCGGVFVLLLLPFILWVLRSRREEEEPLPEAAAEIPAEELSNQGAA